MRSVWRTIYSASLLPLLLLLGVPAAVNGQFTYTINSGTITISGYSGSGGAVTIPGSINGLPVTSIGERAFSSFSAVFVTNVIIPATVSSIEPNAFISCSNLTGVYFQGNAPVADTTVFSGDNNVTIYHLPLTAGWGAWFGGRPTALYGQAVDAFNPGADGAVFAMAVQTDGKILVGGAFTSLAGQPRNHLGRLNPDGTLDVAFGPNADGDVVSLSVQEDGKILVGGNLGQLGGAARSPVGRLNADGTRDATFNAETDGNVSTVALDREGRVVVGGSFSRLNGQARNCLGRLNADGTLDAAFVPQPDSRVSCLAVQADGKIVVGGSFTNLGGRACPYLGRLNADGTLDMDFLGGADGPVNLVSLQADGKVYAAGSFTRLSGVECTGLGRLNPDGSLDAANPGINFPVQSLAIQANGNILVGGGVPYRLGRLNGMFYLDTSFALATDGSISCLALQPEGGILVGGDFQSLAGQPRNRLGRLFDENLPTHNLAYDGVNITWQRYGSSPMVSRTSFDVCTNGTDWVRLGAGTHVANGEQLAAPALPEHALIRARGFVQGGRNGGSGWFVEARSATATSLAGFICATNNGTLIITRYAGSESAIYIPSMINGLPVSGIGDRAFENCSSVVGVMIPNGILNLGYGAFVACPNLKSVFLPGSVTNIGEIAFALCPNLASITIPQSVTQIGREAFDECPSLTAIVVDAGNPSYSSLDGVLFDKNQTRLIRYPGGKTGSFIIPGSVAEIEEFAFNDCYHLTSVTIPRSVTSIGYASFRGCSSLDGIVVDALNSAYSSLDGVLFNKNQTTLIQYPGGRSGSYTIPGGVTSIGDEAFWRCGGLTNMTFPDSLTTIGNRCFVSCTNLTAVYFQGNAPASSSSFIGDDKVIVYYLPGTTGWGASFGWRPTVQVSQPTLSIGPVQNLVGPPASKAFRFSASNLVVGQNYELQGTTNLSIWTPVQTFLAPQTNWVLTNAASPGRMFFRLRMVQ